MKQDYVNLSNVQINMNHKEYETEFMRVMHPLIYDATPEACYGNLFIQGLAPAIKKRVEGSFSEHHVVTAIAIHKQVDILHNSIAATALCVVEEEVVTDLIANRTQGLLNMVQVQPVLEARATGSSAPVFGYYFHQENPLLDPLCAVTPTWCGVMEGTTLRTTHMLIKMVIILLSPTTILIGSTILGETSTRRYKESRERLLQTAASRAIRMIHGGE